MDGFVFKGMVFQCIEGLRVENSFDQACGVFWNF